MDLATFASLRASISSLRASVESVRAGIGIGALVVSSVAAADYSWQVAGSHRDDSTGNLEASRNRLTATYYFSPVDDGEGPYELTAFLNRSSFAAFDAAREQSRRRLIFPALGIIDFGPAVDPSGRPLRPPVGIWPPAVDGQELDLGADASDYAVSGQHVWPEGGWYVGGRLKRGAEAQDQQAMRCYYDPFGAQSVRCEPDLEQSVTDSEGVDLWAGRYFGNETALDLRIGSNVRTTVHELGRALPNFGSIPGFIAPFEPGSETETESAILSVRRAGLLGSSVYWLAANVTSIRSDFRLINLPIPGIDLSPDFDFSTRSNQYGFTAGLYPTRALGFRVSFLRDDEGGGLTGVSASWFFIPRAAVEARITRAEFDLEPTTVDPVSYLAGPGGLDSISLRLLGRF